MNYLNEYITFDNTEELNKAIYLHIRNHTHELNDTERTTLKTIARYAVKYTGVAHLKAKTLSELIGKSEKTARRAVNKLSELGIIKKIATLRKVNGGKGANILVIQPAEESLKPSNVQSNMSSREDAKNVDNAKAEASKNENEPSDLLKQLNNLTTDTSNSIPSNALRSSIPSAIYNALAPFFSADEMYRYYGLLLKAKRKFAPNTTIEQDPEPYVEAINSVLFRVKRGSVRNVAGYFYTSFTKAASEVARKVTASLRKDTSILFYDWLAE